MSFRINNVNIFFVLASVLLFCSVASAELREWTTTSGKTFKGDFIAIIGGKATFHNEKGKPFKVPKEQLSEKDLTFIELENPPKFNIDFAPKSRQYVFPQKEKSYQAWQLPEALDYTFTVKIKQESAGSYNHELTVEYIAIGLEIDGSNYIFLDSGTTTFVPSEYKNKTFTFTGDRSVRVYDYVFFDDGRRGQKYGGYIVTITDSRGKIIAYKSPYKWAIKYLDKIKKLYPNVHFDKTGTRVFPPRPRVGRHKTG